MLPFVAPAPGMPRRGYLRAADAADDCDPPSFFWRKPAGEGYWNMKRRMLMFMSNPMSIMVVTREDPP